jgi:hypothetical protein
MFNLNQWLSVFSLLAPIILALVPGAAKFAPLTGVILKGIADQQAIPGKVGAEKKAAVLALVTDGAQGVNLVKPNTIDIGLATEAAGHAIDAVITSINAVQTAHAAQPTVPALLVPVVK